MTVHENMRSYLQMKALRAQRVRIINSKMFATKVWDELLIILIVRLIDYVLKITKAVAAVNCSDTRHWLTLP